MLVVSNRLSAVMAAAARGSSVNVFTKGGWMLSRCSENGQTAAHKPRDAETQEIPSAHTERASRASPSLLLHSHRSRSRQRERARARARTFPSTPGNIAK
ncbi:hypothetical protein X777_02838 [Ooceraea biroi]|uniref:Uncharacterized protein n=1 Tax=Ooceraea biroi TaxID=2015173 RepID=A0A026WJP1_OOCBI|nr:hypothetical protein X777_02838 [Ooceraea biroi]